MNLYSQVKRSLRLFRMAPAGMSCCAAAWCAASPAQTSPPLMRAWACPAMFSSPPRSGATVTCLRTGNSRCGELFCCSRPLSNAAVLKLSTQGLHRLHACSICLVVHLTCCTDICMLTAPSVLVQTLTNSKAVWQAFPMLHADVHACMQTQGSYSSVYMLCPAVSMATSGRHQLL